MKINTVFILSCLLALTITSRGQYRLEIEISGLRSDQGVIMLQLLDEKQQRVAERKEEISERKCYLTISDLKAGKYAIRYFHDENLSGKMESNSLGIPVEGYGFSNNANGMFGPPSFKNWLFDLNTDKKVQLKPKY